MISPSQTLGHNASVMTRNWTPGSWRTLPVKHIPSDYPDAQALARVERELAQRPLLVTPEETRQLRAALS